MTVRGAVAPDALGFALMHEHLYLDLRPNHPPDQPPNHAIDAGLDDAGAVWDAPLSLSNPPSRAARAARSGQLRPERRRTPPSPKSRVSAILAGRR